MRERHEAKVRERERGRQKEKEGDGLSSELGRLRIRHLAGWLSAVLRERAGLLF